MQTACCHQDDYYLDNKNTHIGAFPIWPHAWEKMMTGQLFLLTSSSFPPSPHTCVQLFDIHIHTCIHTQTHSVPLRFVYRQSLAASLATKHARYY